jgi:1-acyl-sn-glycerol-3-phosphate acyltransferase
MILNKIRAVLTIIQLIITVTIVIILMYLFKKQNRTIRRYWGAIQIKLLGIKLEIVGKADPKALMQLMNHQSILDIIVFEYLHMHNIAWVAKKEIADLPWFGHILKAPDMIIIERESKSSLIKLIKQSKQKIDEKRPIAIFPEGTRGNGKKLRKFKAGAKIIAQKYNLLVQPVVLIGTRELFDSQNFTQKSGIVKIIYLPSIQASKDTNWYEQAEEDMKKIFSDEMKVKNCDN